MDIFQPVETLEAFWREISADIIMNCFGKAWITKEAQAVKTESGEQEHSGPPESSKLVFHYIPTEPSQKTCSSVIFFFCMPTTAPSLPRRCRVKSVRDHGDDNGSLDVDSSCTLPSVKEVLDAADVLHHVTGSADDHEAVLRSFMSYGRCVGIAH